ncbi:Type I phosphodiesterase / nucleotide pyrophosphatase [Novipirellula galeiformis]|uniref:Type I phosphodiesterase / nucleotide pyrophosphatase n=2 Tax=Novipirellula galeiformis TaxID=2528004 RepID=A0A5C6CM08_9BACT|nr:Type I phosphodiesterase / nucleotide pyrophosphatase [Novipirellula galeiformis]
MVACLVAWLCSDAVPSAAADETERHVVVVSLDGLAAYLVDDPMVPLPTIRRLAREGSIADGGMTVSNPSVTWPNHTTLLTGVRPEKHGVLANGVLVRGAIGMPTTIDSRRDQRDLVRMPTIVDVAHAAGLSTAEINWPCTRGSDSFDDQFPDVPDSLAHTTPRLRKELVELGLLSDESDASFRRMSAVGRDHIWTEAACHVIRQRKPNLMLVHLLNVDSVHHTLGPQTAAGYTANAYADMCLARIIAAIDDAGIRERTTLIVVSDHGFTSTPKAIRPNVLLRQAGLLTVDGGKISEAQVHVVPEGGIGLVYCTHPGEAARAAEDFKQRLIGQEGVADVVLPAAYAKLGLQHPREYRQSPDAVLVAADGYAVSGSVDGETLVASNTEARTPLGSHGFLSSLPKMKALCVLSGSGIERGTTLSAVENIDIAPTIASLLELDYPASDGKPLTAAMIQRRD